VTQTIKSDAVTLLTLGSQMGLQGFERRPAKVASEAEAQPTSTSKPSNAANRGRSDASTVMALAKSARLQCVAGEGAL
jgi:hypothetical protein